MAYKASKIGLIENLLRFKSEDMESVEQYHIDSKTLVDP